jgi:hypothetical protein
LLVALSVVGRKMKTLVFCFYNDSVLWWLLGCSGRFIGLAYADGWLALAGSPLTPFLILILFHSLFWISHFNSNMLWSILNVWTCNPSKLLFELLWYTKKFNRCIDIFVNKRLLGFNLEMLIEVIFIHFVLEFNFVWIIWVWWLLKKNIIDIY